MATEVLLFKYYRCNNGYLRYPIPYSIYLCRSGIAQWFPELGTEPVGGTIRFLEIALSTVETKQALRVDPPTKVYRDNNRGYKKLTKNDLSSDGIQRWFGFVGENGDLILQNATVSVLAFFGLKHFKEWPYKNRNPIYITARYWDEPAAS